MQGHSRLLLELGRRDADQKSEDSLPGCVMPLPCDGWHKLAAVGKLLQPSTETKMDIKCSGAQLFQVI